MIDPDNFLLNPFNVPPSVCGIMFGEKAPHTLMMPIVLFTEIGADQTRAIDLTQILNKQLDYEIGRCATGHLDTQVRQVPDIFEFLVGERQSVTWSIMPASAKKWDADGLFLEAGYYNRLNVGLRHPQQEIVNAMMLYDVGVAETGLVEPDIHPPLLVGQRFAQDWTSAVDDLFLARIGVWNRELLDHRTMVLIICRALLTGRDPAVEYRRFKDAGGEYFLDYPRLCP